MTGENNNLKGNFTTPEKIGTTDALKLNRLRMEYEERMTIAQAKASALRIIAWGGIIVLGVVLSIIAFRISNIDPLIQALSYVITCLISFLGGRMSRQSEANTVQGENSHMKPPV